MAESVFVVNLSKDLLFILLFEWCGHDKQEEQLLFCCSF